MFFFKATRRFYVLIVILLGLLKHLSYRMQYSKYEYCVGRGLKIYGDFFLRIKGRLVLGDNVVFINRNRFNPVGLLKKCSIQIAKGAMLTIGDNSGLSGVSIVCSSKIEIGAYCNIGGNVFIWDTDFHPLDYIARRENKETEIVSKPICIEDDVFIGANSIVLKGVRIGSRAVIGAGSVVSRDIPQDEIWAGNPIRFIKKIRDED